MEKKNKLRDRYRGTVCSDCSNNRYNFESDGERPGIDAPTSGDGCWNLKLVKRGMCPLKRQRDNNHGSAPEGAGETPPKIGRV